MHYETATVSVALQRFLKLHCLAPRSHLINVALLPMPEKKDNIPHIFFAYQLYDHGVAAVREILIGQSSLDPAVIPGMIF